MEHASQDVLEDNFTDGCDTGINNYFKVNGYSSGEATLPFYFSPFFFNDGQLLKERICSR